MEASVPVPIRALQGMKRIHLEPGEEQKVELTLHAKQLTVIKDDGSRVVEPGIFEIAVGGALPGTNPPTTQVVTKELRVEGNPYFIE